MKELSIRLKTIASLVPNDTRVCDIGTDHGYLPIYLRLNNLAKSVIAADLNPKPLITAQKNIEKLNANGIELRLCDGLSGINRQEVDTIIIAGMGGNVISGIIDRCDFAKDKDLTFILQPTTSGEILREFLCENGFEIMSETVVFENQKLYSVMVVKFSNHENTYPYGFYYIGNIKPDNENSLNYIKKQQKRLLSETKALENIAERKPEFLKLSSACDYIAKTLTE